jgi:hypothetical protein
VTVTYVLFTRQREVEVEVGHAVTLQPGESVLAVKRKAEGEPNEYETRWFLKHLAPLVDWTDYL